MRYIEINIYFDAISNIEADQNFDLTAWLGTVLQGQARIDTVYSIQLDDSNLVTVGY